MPVGTRSRSRPTPPRGSGRTHPRPLGGPAEPGLCAGHARVWVGSGHSDQTPGTRIQPFSTQPRFVSITGAMPATTIKPAWHLGDAGSAGRSTGGGTGEATWTTSSAPAPGSAIRHPTLGPFTDPHSRLAPRGSPVSFNRRWSGPEWRQSSTFPSFLRPSVDSLPPFLDAGPRML
jgi:hypothetical protein